MYLLFAEQGYNLDIGMELSKHFHLITENSNDIYSARRIILITFKLADNK